MNPKWEEDMSSSSVGKTWNFLKLNFFRGVLGLQQNWEVWNFPYTLCPHTCIASPIINKTHQKDVFLPRMNLQWYNIITHSSSFTVNSWCCIFYKFGQKYNGIYPSLKYHTKNFHCPKNSLCSAYYSLPTCTLATADLLIIFIVLPFPKFLIVGIIQYTTFANCFFHLVMCI